MADFYDMNAAIQKPNIVNALRQGQQYGAQLKQQQQQVADQNALRDLAPKIIAGDPAAFSQGAAIDPKQAGQYQQAGDSQFLKLKGAINYFDEGLKTGDDRLIQARYKEISPYLSNFLGKPVPEAHTPDMLPAFEQLKTRIAMAGPPKGDALKNLRIGGDGYYYAVQGNQFVNTGIKADSRTKVVEGEDGFSIIDERAGVSNPVMQGGGQQGAPSPPAGQQPAPQGQPIIRESNGRQINLTPDLSPEDRAAIMANPDAYSQVPDGGSIELPSIDRSAIQRPQQGQQLRPRDPVQDAIAKKQAEAQIEAQTVADIERAKVFGREAGGADAASAFGTDESRKAAREAQQKLPQVQNAVRGVSRIRSALSALSKPKLGGLVDTGPIDQFYSKLTPEGKELESAVGGIQNSMLALTRVPGVGSQSDLEARVASLQYPSADNPPEVNARTMQNLEEFILDLEEAYNNVISSGARQPGAASPTGARQPAADDPLGIL